MTRELKRLAGASALGAAAIAALVLAVAVAAWRFDAAYPLPLAKVAERSAVVLDRDGALLRAYTIGEGRWRLPVRLADVDPRFIEMLIAYEDKRFYRHLGVDPLALARAGWQMLTHGRIVSGGSTLTMQVARLLEPRQGRSLAAKAWQMTRALQLEARLGKGEILELYLALAPYGGNLEGVRAATLAYFGKEPARLTDAEAALLVSLPQLPEQRRPDRNAAAALAARQHTLRRLVDARALEAEQAAAAARTAVPDRRRDFPVLAPHLADRLRVAAPAEVVYRTTLDRRLQASLEALARRRAAAFGDKRSIAVLVADHRSGEILARVGSADYFDTPRSGQVDMTRALRSPGSTLKPLIYGLAFEAGLVRPATLIEDRPVNFAGYRPQNFDLTYQGTVSVREALQLSLNVPAVALLEAVGAARLVSRLRQAGVEARLPGAEAAGLAVGLGGAGVTMEGLVSLFAVFPRGGRRLALREAPAAVETASARVLSPEASWYVGDILAGTPAPETARAAGIAYKTGTSYGYRDAWAVGFDGRYVAAVWVGRADNAAVPGMTGRGAAAPLLIETFARISPDRVPLTGAPAAVSRASANPVPRNLVRFDMPGLGGGEARPGAPQPMIVYPPRGAEVELGFAGAVGAMPLSISIEGGVPPFRWFANGRPIASGGRSRSIAWEADGAGYSTLTVIDGLGRSDSVSAFLR